MNHRNIDVLERIIRYCNEIDEARKHFDDLFGILKSNTIYKNAVSMCILQIGELTSLLTEEFKLKYNKMPWQDIKAMRNIAAHRYGDFDIIKLWETISEDVPLLRNYCINVVDELYQLNK